MTTEPFNPYEAPKAALEEPVATGPAGSLENAMAGRYDLTIGEVMREAWTLTRGFKGAFWSAGTIYFVVIIVAAGLLALLQKLSPALGLAGNIAFNVVTLPITLGLIMMGVRRAAGLPTPVSTAFNYFDRTLRTLGAAFLIGLFVMLGLVVLVVPGIYLAVCYAATLPLIGDRNLPLWQSMEISRKALRHKWGTLLGLWFVIGLVTTLSAIPLGIPLIWTYPWAVCCLGVVYRRVFGVAGSTSAQATAVTTPA